MFKRVRELYRKYSKHPHKYRRYFKHPHKLFNLIGFLIAQKIKPAYMRFKPFIVDIEPTIRCNLACKMCQITTWDRQTPNLTVSDLDFFCKSIPTLIKIKLQGMGEPFLHKSFFDMVELSELNGIGVTTISNGTLLNEGLVKKITESNLEAIQISLDGATAETFEKIRIKGNFKKVVEGIRRLTSFRGKSNTPIISVWMVGMKENIHELPQMVQLCHDMGVDKLTLQHDLAFWGKEEWMQNLSDQSLTGKMDDHYLDEASALAEKLNFEFDCYRGNKYSVKENKICGWPWASMYISADGYVCPCCVVSDPEVFNFGNLKKQRFDEIWNSDEYKDFRKNMKKGKIPSFCVGCYADHNGIIQIKDAGHQASGLTGKRTK